jgi:hypothetical protein
MNQTRTIFWGGLLLAVGSIGVVIASAFYAVSPIAAALPAGGDLGDALEGALSGRVTLTLAGSVGTVSDVLFAAGSLLLLIFRDPVGYPIERVGWALGTFSVTIFIIVDALSAAVLPHVAGLGISGYMGFKLLYNVLFALGTLIFGLSAPAIFAGELKASQSVVPKWVSWLGMIAGAVSFVSGLLYLVGVALPMVIGVAIAVGAAVFAIYGAQIWRHRR